MKYAIKYYNQDNDLYEYLTDAFGETLIFETAADARDYAEQNIDEGMSMQIVEF